MDGRQVGLGAMLLFLSSAIMLQGGLVDTSLPVAVAGVATLSIAVGALSFTTKHRPGRA